MRRGRHGRRSLAADRAGAIVRGLLQRLRRLCILGGYRSIGSLLAVTLDWGEPALLRNVVVCINQIPDPEAPPEKFRVTPGALQPEPWTGPFVVGPFDENALELALQLRERGFAEKVTALSMGDKRAVSALRRAFTVQADQAVCVQFDPSGLDSSGVAAILAAAVGKLGDVDVVLCGRQGGDWDDAQVGLLLAEALGFSLLTLAKRAEAGVDDGWLSLQRESADGATQPASVRLPAVLTVTNDPSNQLRVAKVRDIMLAERKPIATYTLQDLGFSEPPTPVVVIRGLEPPPPRRKAELLMGASTAERAAALAERLVRLSGRG